MHGQPSYNDSLAMNQNAFYGLWSLILIDEARHQVIWT